MANFNKVFEVPHHLAGLNLEKNRFFPALETLSAKNKITKKKDQR